MALVDAGMPCALCRCPIDDPMRDTFAMTMWGIEDERFAILDDSACHQSCIDQWELRDEFVSYYNCNCKNELFVNRNGHVAYRFDYGNWLTEVILISFAVLFFSPSLAFLELPWRGRVTRTALFVAPYLLLAAFVLACTIKWSLGESLTYALVAWFVSTIVALLAAVFAPKLFRRQVIAKR